MKKIKIDEIVIDAGTQTRVKLNEDTIADYAEAMTDGAKFPAMVVFADGTRYLLADGFHRFMAAQRCGWKEIDADVRKGSKQDAIKYSLGANCVHGLRRTNADKRKCVEIALREFGQLTDRTIAQICGLSDKTIAGYRYLIARPRCGNSAPETRTGQDGKEYPASKISRSNVGGPPPQQVKDALGKVVPSKLLPLWRRGDEIQEMLTKTSDIRCEIEAAMKKKDPLYSEINWSHVKAALDNVYADIKATKPYCVCPMCQGEGCRACGHRGLIGKFRYDISVPKELKK